MHAVNENPKFICFVTRSMLAQLPSKANLVETQIKCARLIDEPRVHS